VEDKKHIVFITNDGIMIVDSVLKFALLIYKVIIKKEDGGMKEFG
jgi:hypothetical protein